MAEENNLVENCEQSEVDPEFLEDFLVETKEHLENIENESLILEAEPGNMESINSMFRAFHTIKGLAGFVEQQLIQKIAHQTETLLDSCRKGKIKVNRRIISLILDSCDLIKKLCESLELSRDSVFLNSVEEHLVELANATNLTEVEETAEVSGKVDSGNGEELVKPPQEPEKMSLQEVDEFFSVLSKEETVENTEGSSNEEKDIENLTEKEIEKDSSTKDVAKTKAHESIENSYMRIPTNKVDGLIDMMGELIIIQSLVEQEAGKRFSTNDYFVNNLLRMSRVMKDIQNLSMSLRMVSLKSTFQKINRIGRDTIIELGKNVNIQIEGEDTEIDRSVAEKILDPLVHMIKNSISHGIGSIEERIKAGKPEQGHVLLKAYSKRGSVYIEVSDDGKGLALDKIHKKALEKGLIDSGTSYSDEEIMNFIFLPGFSTAEVVNNISGRGVGLDVVKTEISKLGGKVEITSEQGKGSTFILKIPINLAIMNGTIVNILGSNYIIPTLNIKEIVQLKDENWVSIRGKNAMIKVREETIPVIPIGAIFGKEDNDETDRLVIILELEQKLKALPVRSIVGKHEIVVKSLGGEFRDLNFISGASILGDGKVSLILDIETLFKMEGKS